MKPHIKRGSSESVRWWGRESGRKPRSRNPALNGSLKSSAWLTIRRSQECMRVTGRFVDREADDLSLGVDAARQNQREVRVRGDHAIEHDLVMVAREALSNATITRSCSMA